MIFFERKDGKNVILFHIAAYGHQIHFSNALNNKKKTIADTSDITIDRPRL